MFTTVRAAALLASLALSACGEAPVSAALAGDVVAVADFIARDPSFTGRVTQRAGTNALGAAYTYAGEFDRGYTREEDFDGDEATLTAGLPKIAGTWRIISTHANKDGANVFADPAKVREGDVVIYNACNTAEGDWAQDQARALRAAVYGTDGKVSEGVSEGKWYKHLPAGTRTEELPPGTYYDGL